MEIVCPSGLRGVVRGLTVGESQILSDRKAARTAMITDNILNKCWEETLAPGPYDLVDGRMDWDKALVGDRAYAILMIRVATYGPSYDFRVTCPTCGEPVDCSINLEELPVKNFKEDSLAQWKAGNRFQIPFGDHKISFRLIDGTLQREAQRNLKNTNNPLAASLAMRILDVEGEPNKMQYLRNLPMGTALELIDRLDEHDCGIDTEVEGDCYNCGSFFEIELPFGKGEFWKPQKRRKQ